MNEDTLRSLRQAHGFDEWYGRNTLPESLFIRGFSVQPGVLAGWRVQRVTPVRVPGAPAYTRALLTPEGGPDSTVLRLDAYECASRRAAHEFLVQVVAQFETAGAARRDDLAVGDVSFTPVGQGAVVFTRGNLVFVLAQVGTARLPMLELARELDRELSGKPAETKLAARAEAASGMPPVRLSEAEPGGRVVLQLDAPEPPAAAATPLAMRREPEEAPTYHKIFTPTGEVHAEGEQLVYEPTRPGPPRIEVYTVESPGRAQRRTVEGAGS